MIARQSESLATRQSGTDGEPAVRAHGSVTSRSPQSSRADCSGGWWRTAPALLIAALLAAGSTLAQPAQSGGQIVVPGSSLAKPGDTGVRAHTNTLIFVPNRGPVHPHPNGADESPPKPRHTGTATGEGSKPE